MTYRAAWETYLERHLRDRAEAGGGKSDPPGLSEAAQRAMIERLAGPEAVKGDPWMFPKAEAAK